MQVEVCLPESLNPDERVRLVAAEHEAGRKLLASGIIRRIWRVPGRFANVAIYDVADATELHSAISTLPLFAWLDVRVTALAVHPLEAAMSSSPVTSRAAERRG